MTNTKNSKVEDDLSWKAKKSVDMYFRVRRNYI